MWFGSTDRVKVDPQQGFLWKADVIWTFQSLWCSVPTLISRPVPNFQLLDSADPKGYIELLAMAWFLVPVPSLILLFCWVSLYPSLPCLCFSVLFFSLLWFPSSWFLVLFETWGCFPQMEPLMKFRSADVLGFRFVRVITPRGSSVILPEDWGTVSEMFHCIYALLLITTQWPFHYKIQKC